MCIFLSNCSFEFAEVLAYIGSRMARKRTGFEEQEQDLIVQLPLESCLRFTRGQNDVRNLALFQGAPLK